MKPVWVVITVSLLMVFAGLGIGFFTYQQTQTPLSEVKGASPYSITFTWDEPVGYDQIDPHVIVQGSYSWLDHETGLSGITPEHIFCEMKEDVPGSGRWSCIAAFPVRGTCMSFRIWRADPPPIGWCNVLDECTDECGGNGSPFGTVTLTSDVVDPDDVPFSANHDRGSTKLCHKIGETCFAVSYLQ